MKLNRLMMAVVGAFVLLPGIILSPERARSHCDTLDGPVVQEARTALQTGEITPVLKWVRAADEQEIKAAFARTLAVRSKGEEARELADLYFFETLVRIHRAGEGAPYTGLKTSDSIDHAVVLADQALAEGNVDKLVTVLTGAMAEGIRTRFQETLASKKHADDSVAAGRDFVKNYVVFTHYAEGLHTMLQGKHGPHGEIEQAGKATGHDH
jgi:hypothetical protein